jgi:mannose-6-phosphate isomerase-like protein (cupin superfamily)
MDDPMIIFSSEAPVEIHGGEGGSGSLLWKRLAGGVDLHGDWESFEYARLQPGGGIGEHVHDRTEEIYFITEGQAWMHMDDRVSKIGPGDLILTPINGRHSAATIGDDGLEFIVAEVLPPEILYPERAPAAGQTRVTAAETPIITLEPGQPIDPGPYFNGPWESIQLMRIQPGDRAELSADGVEHAFYVVSGRGTAVSRTRTIELGPGRGMALPKGGQVTLRGESEPLQLFVVTVRV